MRVFKQLGKKGQTGQSLVILAIGFLALLGFVGIVTDVSVLFIRYSTLRRAIDAAAIAAAGQMRRVEDSTNDGIAQGEATSVANLNLAARQFMEVYGLDPKNVVVETCRAQNVALDGSGHPLDANGHLLFNTDGSVNTAADPATVKSYQQLCTKDELKLVRVTAQIDAPTFFLRLLGYPTVTLTASSISQTAVIDAVLIFDVSESMLNETTYDDWDNIPGAPKEGVRYVPPCIQYCDINPSGAAWTTIVNTNEASLDNTLNISNDNPTTTVADLGHLIRFEPNGGGGYQEWVNGTATGRVQPRDFCRVRAYPTTQQYRSPVTPDMQTEYQSFFATYATSHPGDTYAANFDFSNSGPWYSGFVPMYNYYGCANDPNGDFLFDDLIARPFKDARDRAHGFLDRLDFLRGDRVGFVTFDRQAYIVDPDGDGTQAALLETQNDLYTIPTDPTSPLLRKGADETLDDSVGVMTDPTHYCDDPLCRTRANGGIYDGLWSALNDGGTGRSYNDFLTGVQVGDIINHPVLGACPDDKALLDPPYLNASAQVMPDGVTPRTSALLDTLITVPTWFMTGPDGPHSRFRSYENRASCAGTNIGGALAAGSATLYNQGRREGAVWIMVMLSDGAAGASDPITKFNNVQLAGPQPYAVNGAGFLSPLPGSNGPICTDSTNPVYPCTNTQPDGVTPVGGYGWFGLCPYGTYNPVSNPSGTETELLKSDTFPVCSDLDPATRHYCGSVAVMPDAALDADTRTNKDGCINLYDVDDYAHDWADWVGLAELPGSVSGGTTGRVSDQLLPTLFTIGFGVDYNGASKNGTCASTDYDCIRGVTQGSGTTTDQRERGADYLGEELLRYIADVGDNFQIDSDYWQLNESSAPNTCSGTGAATDRIGNCIKTTSPDWGARGPCQSAWTDTANPNNRGNALDPLPPEQDCGNYYNAPNGTKLQQVFNDIASRMFTRLSQ